jgi:peptidoglycan hydrolase-like protein with peptidoglycan-binding domain
VRDREFRARPKAAALDGDLSDARLAWRSLVLQALGRRPVDSLAICVAVVAGGAIFVNALTMQKGPHPAPLFYTSKQVAAREPTGAVALPRPRPAEIDGVKKDAASRPKAEIVAEIQRELTRRGFYDGNADGVYGPKTDTAIRDFEQVAGFKPSAEPNEALLRSIARSHVRAPAPAPRRPNDPIADLLAPSKQVLAVQRALADFGYGQIPASGLLDPQTQAAIRRFERDRKLPITGQISDRLARELTALSGRPLD